MQSGLGEKRLLVEITWEGGVACDWSSAGSWSAWRLVIGLWVSFFIYHRKLPEVRIFTGGIYFLAWTFFSQNVHVLTSSYGGAQ